VHTDAAGITMLRSTALLLPVLASSETHDITIEEIDWAGKPLVTAPTASTVEVDVMPFLGRARPECEKAGKCTAGPFNGYYEALQDLGAEYVRYAPWYPYPKVVVTELYPPDCTAMKPATNWNSTNFDAIMRDFMSAVCGPDAVSGKCDHSVVQQLSTMPSWLYVGGTDPKTGINQNMWEYNGFADYNHGTALKDESCKPMAAYMARLVCHYTSGGHHDTCGHWHPSGFHYTWTGLSVLNENEHKTGAQRYTKCFDEIKKAVRQCNPTIFFAGPEGTGYTDYLIDPKNHEGGDASLIPDILSLHQGFSAGGGGASYEKFFSDVDGTIPGVRSMVALRDKLAPKTGFKFGAPQFVTNEFIPFMNDWCDPDSAAALFEQHPELERHPDSPGVLQTDGTIVGGTYEKSEKRERKKDGPL
jgi:hypothetical protein